MICGSLEMVKQIVSDRDIVKEQSNRSKQSYDGLHAHKEGSKNACFNEKSIFIANIKYIVAVKLV